MDESKILISASPHIHTDVDTSNLMYKVILALIPAIGFSIFVFGWGALITLGVAIISCVLIEFFIMKFMLRGAYSINDGSALLTGILLAINLPSHIPIWMIFIGSLVAIGIGKLSFGGLGNNIFNPALVGRVFMLISFPVEMTSWPKINQNYWMDLDATTGATPLGILKEGMRNGDSIATIQTELPNYFEMFLGFSNGSMGETSIILLLLGGFYLLYTKVISWHIPLSILGSFTLLATLIWWTNPNHFANPIFHMLSGGIVLGAFFMATDMVTSPMSKKGMLVFGIGIGSLTILIRTFGAYPEGVSFAILIMNAFVPLIDRYFKPIRFGNRK